ncbi:family 16 glycosylhydrolase [Reyranella sp.]|uniref:family 16 glycosylhydrolase n=1 Tax=Reyranella sp. TaxID=1929291 RepID=UPI0011F4B895|nr:family 16 glycosylhydrolase [Reyranella sp.]TAJ88341.1 MAG: glycosyl hydrolase family protein [Reyranella sp.]
MATPLKSTTVLFEDHFSTDGKLNAASWDYNHWQATNNPSWLGLTQMRQELPDAQNGVARIRLDTWLDGNGFKGSEAITKEAWDLSGGSVAFEGKFKFDSTQGGMIAGFFTFQQFPMGADRDIHDEIDYEIITSNPAKISTNVFAHETLKETAHPLSIAIPDGTTVWHTYRMEWTASYVRWFVDGKEIRTETNHVPTTAQQLHLNLWGVPKNWGPSDGDKNGPPVGDPTFLPATSAAENKSYFFDVDYVKVERVATLMGDGADNVLNGTADNDGIEGGAGNDTLFGDAGDDTLAGGQGNDVIDGGTGNDSLIGGEGFNILTGGVGSDRFYMGPGSNTARDTLADLAGDTFFDFGTDDAIAIQGTLVDRSDLAVTNGAEATTLQVGGSSFELAGDYSGGDFMIVARGTGADASSSVTFVPFLPSLAEGKAVNPTLVNGIANEPFLSGDGSVDFSVSLKSAASTFANTLGAYKIAADGTIRDVQVLFDNTLNVAAGAREVDLGTPAAGERIAFFLIQNGFAKLGTLPDNLSFVAPGTMDPADIRTGADPVLHSATLGDLAGATIFHSMSTLNPNDAMQVLSGVAAGGQELFVGFEDLPTATGDNDFQDVVISIHASSAGLLFA